MSMGESHPAEGTLFWLTRLLLLLWAVVTIPGGVLLVVYPPFATVIVWPPPLPEIPPFHAQMSGAIGIGTGAASVFALWRNRWASAEPLIALYVAYGVIAEYVALTQVAAGPVPWQIWFYIGLGAFYLVSSFVVWRQQSRTPS